MSDFPLRFDFSAAMTGRGRDRDGVLVMPGEMGETKPVFR
ncbi:hypothetical protein PC123_g27093, partial [Phytophthora cactorum]